MGKLSRGSDICTIAGCTRLNHARGLCPTHYTRWKRHGDADTVLSPVKGGELAPLEDRFWKKVQKGDGCWVWLGSVNSAGYGWFSLGGKSKKAHRVAFELMRGAIPKGLQMDHLCRTPPVLTLTI